MPATPDFAPELRSLLLGDAPRIVVGIVSIAIGLGSILLHLLRRRVQDRLLLWFGLLVLLYGYRVVLMTQTAQYFAPAGTIRFQILLLTYTIGIPAILFGWGLVAKQHNWLTKSLLGMNALLALTYLAFLSNSKVQEALGITNNVFVVSITLAILAYLFVLPQDALPELRSLRIIFGVWGLFVLYNNLRGWLTPGVSDFEFVGFFLFLCSLGYLVVTRNLRTEEALAAIHKELEIARRIQTSILPEAMPQVHGIQLAAHYVPMSQVAGDFYDFLVVDDHSLGILIADVSGHGVPAALVASMVKVAIAAQAEHAEDPAEVMAGLNSILSGKLQGQFVTAAYLFLDAKSGTGKYSAAGHPPLLHYRAATQAIEDVVENGLILGVMPFATYQTKSIAVGVGDRFLLYTDGVLEADHGGEEFGEARLKRVLARPLSPHQRCAELCNEVTSWTNGVANDDVTILAVDLI